MKKQQEHGKLPPQAIEIEEAILGAIMLEKDALLEVIDLISAQTFYKESNQKIYESILDLNNNSEPIDILTVIQNLKKKGNLDIVGGAYYVTQLTNRVSSAANITSHARIIEQQYLKRKIISLGSNLSSAAYDDTTDVFDITENLLTEAYNLGDINSGAKEETNIMLLRRIKQNIETAKTVQGITGLTTGIDNLDKITRGYQKTHLIIKAGRPAMGKSSQALCEANHIAHELDKKVLFFSLEMSAIELMQRLVAVNSEISLWRLQRGDMSPDDWRVYNNATSKMMNDNLRIVDTPGLSLNALRKVAKKHKIKQGLDIIFIDYLQLINHKVHGANREQEISAISGGLKALAKELDIPIIALSQLSRAVESRGGSKKPQLSDLRESGSIEQDADMVQFLYRPEYYGLLEDDDGVNTSGKGFLIIAKNRHGALKDVEMRFIPELTKFTNWEEHKDFIPQEPYQASAGIKSNDNFDDDIF